ncbi:MAG TPA: hypothetical protein VK616_01550 [Flavitalea sp.]|nr:hypothetical protein [Flavitalea sp.]HTF30121.1 hypothetical protein [Flavitalea sp.]
MSKKKEPILLFAFLHELKQKDHKAYLLILICILIQVALTFIKLEVTPFFLFGMYSEKIAATDTFSIIRVLVNDKPIDSYNPPLREKHLLETNAANYVEMKRNNHTDILKIRIESRYAVIYNSAFYPYLAGHIYNTPMAQNNFKGWLKQKCLKIASIDDGVVKIVETTYLLNRTTLYLNPIRHETLDVL